MNLREIKVNLRGTKGKLRGGNSRKFKGNFREQRGLGLLTTNLKLEKICFVTGKSLDHPDKGNVDKMSEKCRKMPENVQKLSGGTANTISRKFVGHLLPIWSVLLFGDPVQCSPVTRFVLALIK